MARATFALLGLAALTALAFLVPSAGASAIIDNGVVQLGVLDHGNLNVPGGVPSSGTGTTIVGVRYLPTGAEATAPGCTCEGWGVSSDSSTSGWADIGGAVNLGLVSFAQPQPDTAVSVVKMGTLTVTHDYHPSAVPELYEATVTIENTGGLPAPDVRYRRVMDWDVEPTAFSEYVSIHAGNPPATNLLYSSDDGFASGDPLAAPTSILVVGPPANPDFDDSGPADHGALFDFGFGSLAPGASRVFKIFYGAAGTEADALAALAGVNAEVWSLGQPSTANGPTDGSPNTFMFAFGGVGGQGSTCDGYVKHGRAATVLGTHEDVGGTGLIGPGVFGVHDSGNVDTNTTHFSSDVDVYYSSPLVEARIMANTFAHEPCEAYAETLTVNLTTGPALPGPLVTKDVGAWARVSCYKVEAYSRIAYLEFGGSVIVDTETAYPPNTVVNLGAARIILNEQYPIPHGIAVNAARVVVPGVADVQIGHAEASITPCGPVFHDCDGLVVGLPTGKECPGPDCPPIPGIPDGLTPVIGGGTVDPCVECEPTTPRDGLAAGGPGGIATPVLPKPCDPCETIKALLAPFGIVWDCGGCIRVDGSTVESDVSLCFEPPCDPRTGVGHCARPPCELLPPSTVCERLPCGGDVLTCTLEPCAVSPLLCVEIGLCDPADLAACLSAVSTSRGAAGLNPNGVAWVPS